MRKRRISLTCDVTAEECDVCRYLSQAAELRHGALLFGASQLQQLVSPAVALPWCNRANAALISAGAIVSEVYTLCTPVIL